VGPIPKVGLAKCRECSGCRNSALSAQQKVLQNSSAHEIFTSAKEVMFLPDFVCLYVSKITRKVMDGSF